MPSFEVVVDRIVIDEDGVTLDLSNPDMPEGDHVPDEWCAKQRAWFAGLNDEANEDVGIAFYDQDASVWKAGGRVRITVEPMP